MKKKIDLKKLALLGISGGLLVTAQGNAAPAADAQNQDSRKAVCGGGCGGGKGGCGSARPPIHEEFTEQPYRRSEYSNERIYNESRDTSFDQNHDQHGEISERDLQRGLSPEGKKLYNRMNEQTKRLARQYAGSNNFSNLDDAVRAAADQSSGRRNHTNNQY